LNNKRTIGIKNSNRTTAMPAFNLVTDPWIPVRWIEPSRHEPLVSLGTLFAEAERIADLSANPAERVSLMRLLVCATQAALGAPAHPKAWSGFGEDLATAVPEYLERPQIRERFELFGDGARFLQAQEAMNGSSFPTSKLFPNLATGNNPTIFDHEGGTRRAFRAESIALGLLVFQCFYPRFGQGYLGTGPCVDSNMLHLLLRGATLADCIRRNCLDAETIAAQFPSGIGRPIWEAIEDSTFCRTVTETYLGRLVPRHRDLLLNDEGTEFLLVPESLSYPAFESAIEPTATVFIKRTGEKAERKLLPAKEDRAAWRDLHLMCALRIAMDGIQGAAPLVLKSHLAEIMESDVPEAHIWVGGLIVDNGKFVNSVESLHTVPTRMLSSYDGLRDYEVGVGFADDMRWKHLRKAVAKYAEQMKHRPAPIPQAERRYWDALDRDSGILLNLVADPEAMAGREFGKGRGDETDPWTRAVRSALRFAYEATCPRQNPRQLEAYAAGLRVLFPTAKKKAKAAKKAA
jgi:CRISPR system Cascade subunit CasA